MSWLDPVSWYALWDGQRWNGPRKLTAAQADEWAIDILEAYSFGTQRSIALYRWNGSAWQRAR